MIWITIPALWSMPAVVSCTIFVLTRSELRSERAHLAILLQGQARRHRRIFESTFSTCGVSPRRRPLHRTGVLSTSGSISRSLAFALLRSLITAEDGPRGSTRRFPIVEILL